MLTIKSLTCGYLSPRTVVENLSLEVEKGEIVTLIGPNGSGKSTLLKAIFGLLPYVSEASKIRFAGLDILNEESSSRLKMGIVYIPQSKAAFLSLTVDENLKIASTSLPKKLVHSRIEYVESLFSVVTERKSILVGKLSGGQQKQVALAMGLLHRPQLILLDEPITGLDEMAIDIVLDTIKTFQRDFKTAFIIVEHQIELMHSLTNRIIGLREGKIVINKLPANFTELDKGELYL